VSTDPSIQLVTQLFDAFTRRDHDALRDMVGPEMEFSAPTAAIARGGAPYVGGEGMSQYLDDVASVWRELRVIPQSFRSEGGSVLATGRVYARDHEGSIIDSPVGWVFEIRDGAVVSGRTFERAEDAVAAFEAR
jgi:ketosteroid isomerase-like protein